MTKTFRAGSDFVRAAVLCAVLLLLCGPALFTAGEPEKFDGYAEWRKGDVLIVDGQRIRAATDLRFRGERDAKSFATVPLGYEVNGRGVRQPDGTIVAVELQAKANGTALFENEVKRATQDMETKWVKAGAVSQGSSQNLGRLHTTGSDVDRVRGTVMRLVPPYLKPADFRVYVVENKDWNAFACANGMIVVHDSLLKASNDDELAIVLGHELVHATHEHSRKEMKNAMWLQLAAAGAAATAESLDSNKSRAVVDIAATFTILALHNGYGRDKEDQADRVGLRYAYEGGYDVRKGPALWHRFAEKYGNSNAVSNFFFSDHSRSETRARNLEHEIALNYPARR